MCLAVPGKLVKVEGLNATVNIVGTEVAARLDFIEDAAIGDYVLVHAGFAITKMDPDEAAETLALLKEVALLDR